SGHIGVASCTAQGYACCTDLRDGSHCGRSPRRAGGLGEALSRRTDPVHRSILAIDIERSTTRTNLIKLELRRQIYKLLGEAMTAAGIRESHCEPLADRGDGVLVLIYPLDEVP